MAKNLKFKIKNSNSGMTYVELIVVLSIFSIMSAIGLFSYKEFQIKVDIKNLANDIALKFVQAQKESTTGKLPVLSMPSADPWKPSYGLLFTSDSPSAFLYFADLDQGKVFDGPYIPCPSNDPGNSVECLETITITKGNFVSDISIFIGATATEISEAHITFTRPDSGATLRCTGDSICAQIADGTTIIDFLQITISSPQGTSSLIKVYPSGRIQLN